MPVPLCGEKFNRFPAAAFQALRRTVEKQQQTSVHRSKRAGKETNPLAAIVRLAAQPCHGLPLRLVCADRRFASQVALPHHARH